MLFRSLLVPRAAEVRGGLGDGECGEPPTEPHCHFGLIDRDDPGRRRTSRYGLELVPWVWQVERRDGFIGWSAEPARVEGVGAGWGAGGATADRTRRNI